MNASCRPNSPAPDYRARRTVHPEPATRARGGAVVRARQQARGDRTDRGDRRGTAPAAVDGGKSALRLAVSGSTGIRYAEAPGFGYAPGQDDVATIMESVRRAAERLAPLDVDRVCAGLTGAPGEPTELARLHRALGALFGTDEVTVVADVVLAHA